MSTSKSSKTSIFAVVMILFAKSAKLIKLMKFAKPFITFGTMALSAFAYAFWLGPWFAVGLTVMLFVHEMGHVIALRQKGYEVSAPVFIPFLGAAIFVPKFTDRDTEAYVGYGGPLLGTIGALALFAAWFFMSHDTAAGHLVLITSYAAIYLNLFNMIPLSPLDGGRITQATGAWFQYVGVSVLAVVTFFFREPVILYIWVLVLSEITFIRLRLRAILAVVCTIAMTILMLLGYSDQPWFVDLIDVVFASLFSLMLVLSTIGNKDPLNGKDTRPNLSVRSRIRWFVLYAGLTAALVAILFYQHSLLPEMAG